MSNKNKYKDKHKNPRVLRFWWLLSIWNFFDPNISKIDENWYKNVYINYIGYVRIKDSKYVKTNSVNPLYLLFSKVNGYFEKNNKNLNPSSY